MPKKREVKVVAGEERLPDLSRSDDLNHPINRNRGIDNYCDVLMDG